MNSSGCVRHLPQHFNGCACVALPGSVSAEAEVVLLIESQDSADADEFPALLGAASRAPWGVASDPADLLARAYESAEYWAQRKGSNSHNIVHMDVDDLAQEVWLRLHDRTRLEGREEFNRDYISRIASNLVATTARPMTAESRKGLVPLREAIDRHDRETGRYPDDVEIARLAEQIREGWPDQRHRPSDGFEQYLDPEFETTVPIETMSDHASPPGVPAPDSEGPHVSAALDGIDQVHGATRKDARRGAWNAYAEMTGLPIVSERATPRQITTARKTLTKDEVPAAAVKSLGLPFDHPTRKALLMPWPDASMIEQKRILEALSGDYGDDLWDSAVIASRG